MGNLYHNCKSYHDSWMDGVKVALGNREMTVEAARQCAKDRKALVHMYLNEFNAAIFACHCSF